MLLKKFQSIQSKLTITFLIVSIAGTFFTTLIVYLSNRRAFDELSYEQRKAAVVDEVIAYYQINQSWENAATDLRNQLRVAPEPASAFGGQPPEMPPLFALIDTDNRIIIPNPQFPPGDIVSQQALANGIILEIEGEPIGTLLLDEGSPLPSHMQTTLLTQANQALILGALGGTTVAIFLAIFISQMLTKPLKELATASHQLADGRFYQSVPVRTHDELGKLTSAFNHMSAELDRLNRVRQQMTADIAHDLGTPLTVLSGYLEAMEEGTLSATPARLQMMRQEVKTLQRLVEDLSTLTLADAGKLTLTKEMVLINDLLDQVKEAYVYQADQKMVTLHVDADTEIAPILADPSRIRQALGNLVSNALRYTLNGGSIKLSAFQNGQNSLTIAVKDSGSGIPAEDLPNIFHRFYRVDRSRQQDRNSGSGLGLAITKSIIEAHAGTIEVSSVVDHGTTFTIVLPL